MVEFFGEGLQVNRILTVRFMNETHRSWSVDNGQQLLHVCMFKYI